MPDVERVEFDLEIEIDPTVSRGRLARALRQARLDAGQSQQQAGEALGWSVSKVIRVEGATVGVTQTDVRAMLSQYGISDAAAVDHCVQLSIVGRRQPWGQYRDVLAGDELRYLAHEGSAARIRLFEFGTVPDLLQTEAFACRLISQLATPHTAPDATRRLLQARMTRQLRLRNEESVTAHVILDEAVVRRIVGPTPQDRHLMVDQLAWIRSLAQWPSITVQILPFTAGVHVGLLGPFTLVESVDAAIGEVLFLDDAAPRRLYPCDHPQVARYQAIFGDLADGALDADRSSGLLDQIIDDLTTTRC